jgi:glutamyl-tRNA reductase
LTEWKLLAAARKRCRKIKEAEEVMKPGSWHLVVCGLNHKTASLDIRETLQIGKEKIAEAHARFHSIDGIKETAIVATCNRIEFYFIAGPDIEPFSTVADFYTEFAAHDIDEYKESFYVLRNMHAAKHLFEVAAGIDSMIIGENQILGQLKEAYSSSCRVKTAGKVIHRMFHQAFRVGKQVRTDTEMGRGACSVSSAAVELLKTRLANFDNPSVLFIGVNQMISLAAAALYRLEVTNFMFANRTIERARALGQKYDSEIYSFEGISGLLARADIAITCTGSDRPFIDRATIDAHPESLHKPLLILDLAVPRDTALESDPEHDLEILDLEAIQKFVSKQQEKRKEAIPQVEGIIKSKLEEFKYWFNHVRNEPLYNGLSDAIDQVRREEIAKIEDNLSAAQIETVNRAVKRITDRLLQLKINVKTDVVKED